MIKINRRVCFYALMTLLFALILVRYAFQVDIPRIVLTAVVVLMAFVGDQNEALAVLMCCIPMHEAVDFYYSILLCAIIYVLKSLKSFKITAVTIVVIFSMVVYELLHCFYDDFSFRLFLVNISTILVILAVMGVGLQNINYVLIVRMMAVCAAFMGFMLIVNLLVRSNGNFAVAFYNMQRLGQLSEDDILQGGAIHPNSLGIISVLATSGLMQASLKGQGKKFDVALIVFLLLIGFLTLSRTFLACLLLVAFLWIIGQPGTVRKKVRTLFSIILIGCVLLVLVSLIFPDILETFIGRFRVDDITTGRDTLFVDYHRFIMDNPNVMLFGVGLNNYGEKLINVYHVSDTIPHNSIQEIILAWGIPGLFLFVLMLLCIIIESKRYGVRKNLINYIPLLLILFKSMAGQLLTSGYSMLALSFAYLSLCQDFSPKTNDENVRL